jgi:hypothetical protein
MIVKVVKRSHFTMISNLPLNDSRLSWEARGLLAWLISKPNTWIVNREAIARHGKTGRDKVRRMLAELTTNGYLTRTRHRSDDGQFRWNSIVYEEPIDQDNVGGPIDACSQDSAENPQKGEQGTEKPSAVEPSVAKPPVVRTKSQSTDSERTEDQIPERAGAPVAQLNQRSGDFCLDDELRQFAKACGCDVDDELRAFRKYCGSKKKTYSDYRAGFMGWIGKTARFGFAVHLHTNDETVAESSREKCKLKKDCGHICHHIRCSNLAPDRCHYVPSIERRQETRVKETSPVSVNELAAIVVQNLDNRRRGG